MQYHLLAMPILQAMDSNGAPLPLATLTFSEAGGATPLAVYADSPPVTSLGAVVTADSGGFFVPIYLQPKAYRIVLKSAAGATLRTIDPVYGDSLWMNFDDTFTLKNAADPTKKMMFDVSPVSAGQTSVLAVPDADGTLVLASLAQTLAAKTLTTVASLSMSGRLQGAQGAVVASANDMALGMDGNAFIISGTTTINRISGTGWQAGSEITLRFSGNVTVTHGTASSGAFLKLNLAGAANFSATDQDTLQLILLGSEWYETGRTVI